MKSKLMILMTLTLVATTALVAQRGPRGDRAMGEGMRAPNFDALVAALELTDAQLTSLQENSQAGRESMKALFEQIGPLHEQLKAELDADAPNSAVVGELTVQLDAVRDQIKEAKEKTRADALSILTPSQQEALTAIVESEERSREKFGVIRTAAMLGLLERGPGMGRRGFGPGGFGPGGPGHHRGPRPGAEGAPDSL